MVLAVLGHDYGYEMECVTRLFFPGEKISVVREEGFADEDVIITRIASTGDFPRLIVKARFRGFKSERAEEFCAGDNGDERERRLSALLFGLLQEMTGLRPAWGILTGIRPVRLCHRWAQAGLSTQQIRERLLRDYLVLPEKAALTMEIMRTQAAILSRNAPDSFSLYVGIPFCPTRCLYCSFISHDIAGAGKLVPQYVELLCEEIRRLGELAQNFGRKLLTVYVGGGTPTALLAEQLSQILFAVRESFDFSQLMEYTVEAGRPDTITEEKLQVLRRAGVNRISVNPQTMNDEALKKIGRAHSAAQTVQSFALARRAGFQNINMDLIAGLPGDTALSFADSLGQVLALSPESITVHALTVKRSSRLREREDAFSGANPHTGQMLETACSALKNADFWPYYLYRQKATVDNLENVGYAKRGFSGVYNIFSMDDAHTILAAGAGSVSKICGAGQVSRFFNCKYPFEYVGQFAKRMQEKQIQMAKSFSGGG